MILTGGIDLSIGWNLNLAAILLTQLSEQMPVFWAAVAALASAASSVCSTGWASPTCASRRW